MNSPTRMKFQLLRPTLKNRRPMSTLLFLLSLLGLLPFIASGLTILPRRRSKTTPTQKSSNDYYSYKTFKRLAIPALAYSAIAKTAVRLLNIQPKGIPSSPKTKRRKVAIVTGSNTGVGYETAKALVVDHGMEVIIACRSLEKGIQACQSINLEAKGSGMAVFVEPIDLADMDSIQAFAKAVHQQYDTVDVLVNNAGRNSAGTTESTTTTSLDLVFSTNFLGHFLLTNLLLEKCRRIVNLASVMHHFPIYKSTSDSDHDIGQVEYWKTMAMVPPSKDGGETAPIRKTYGPSKLAALLFSIELNRRYGESKGIRSIAVNPGAVYSDIWRNYPRVMQYLYRLFYLSPKQGSTTSVAACVLDDLDPSTIYLQPYLLPAPAAKKKKPPFPLFEMLGAYVGYVETVPRLPQDGGLEACQSLFQVCEELTGCKYDDVATNGTTCAR